MQPHQERVVAEKKELDEKIEKLTSFLTNDESRAKLSDAEQDRMQRQLDCMNAYSGILGERIDAFTVPDTAVNEEAAPGDDQTETESE